MKIWVTLFLGLLWLAGHAEGKAEQWKTAQGQLFEIITFNFKYAEYGEFSGNAL